MPGSTTFGDEIADSTGEKPLAGRQPPTVAPRPPNVQLQSWQAAPSTGDNSNYDNRHGRSNSMDSLESSGSSGSSSGGNSYVSSRGVENSAEIIPTRAVGKNPKLPSHNPLQFVKVLSPLYQKVEHQITITKEPKICREAVKEGEEEWQSNLDNWKSRRRKVSEKVIQRAEEMRQIEAVEQIRQEQFQLQQRKIKKFSEIIEKRSSTRTYNLDLYIGQGDDSGLGGTPEPDEIIEGSNCILRSDTSEGMTSEAESVDSDVLKSDKVIDKNPPKVPQKPHPRLKKDSVIDEFDACQISSEKDYVFSPHLSSFDNPSSAEPSDVEGLSVDTETISSEEDITFSTDGDKEKSSVEVCHQVLLPETEYRSSDINPDYCNSVEKNKDDRSFVEPALVQSPDENTHSFKICIKPGDSKGFGFSLRGGKDHGCAPYVESITKYGAADLTGLKEEDKILTLNGKQASGYSHASLIFSVKQASYTGILDITVHRSSSDESASESKPKLTNRKSSFAEKLALFSNKASEESKPSSKPNELNRESLVLRRRSTFENGQSKQNNSYSRPTSLTQGISNATLEMANKRLSADLSSQFNFQENGFSKKGPPPPVPVKPKLKSKLSSEDINKETVKILSSIEAENLIDATITRNFFTSSVEINDDFQFPENIVANSVPANEPISENLGNDEELKDNNFETFYSNVSISQASKNSSSEDNEENESIKCKTVSQTIQLNNHVFEENENDSAERSMNNEASSESNIRVDNTETTDTTCNNEKKVDVKEHTSVNNISEIPNHSYDSREIYSKHSLEDKPNCIQNESCESSLNFNVLDSHSPLLKNNEKDVICNSHETDESLCDVNTPFRVPEIHNCTASEISSSGDYVVTTINEVTASFSNNDCSPDNSEIYYENSNTVNTETEVLPPDHTLVHTSALGDDEDVVQNFENENEVLETGNGMEVTTENVEIEEMDINSETIIFNPDELIDSQMNTSPLYLPLEKIDEDDVVSASTTTSSETPDTETVIETLPSNLSPLPNDESNGEESSNPAQCHDRNIEPVTGSISDESSNICLTSESVVLEETTQQEMDSSENAETYQNFPVHNAAACTADNSKETNLYPHPECQDDEEYSRELEESLDQITSLDIIDEIEQQLMHQLEQQGDEFEELDDNFTSQIEQYFTEDSDLLDDLTPRNLEPPSEPPPPPPSEDTIENQVNPPMNRANSTKRIKKELWRRRSDFLGLNSEEGIDIDKIIPPPPGMEEILKQEREQNQWLEKRLSLAETDISGPIYANDPLFESSRFRLDESSEYVSEDKGDCSKLSIDVLTNHWKDYVDEEFYDSSIETQHFPLSDIPSPAAEENPKSNDSPQHKAKQNIYNLGATPKAKIMDSNKWITEKVVSVSRKSIEPVVRQTSYNQNYWLAQDGDRKWNTQPMHSSIDRRYSMPPNSNPHPDVTVRTWGDRENEFQKQRPHSVVWNSTENGEPMYDLYSQKQDILHTHSLDSRRETSCDTDTLESEVHKCSCCGKGLCEGSAMGIEALRLYFHIECFRCCLCHMLLGNGSCGTDVQVKNNQLYCPNCFTVD